MVILGVISKDLKTFLEEITFVLCKQECRRILQNW